MVTDVQREVSRLASFLLSNVDTYDQRMQTVCQDMRARIFPMQGPSVAMQRGNHACILGTIANEDFSSEIFCLIRPLYYSSLL